jgi:phage terminase Nu1 subunit (DNA packaging protein)
MEFLSGWKEIADYLRLTVRTVQRWERLGLPVRRVSDSPCSPVVAFPDDLERWVRARRAKKDASALARNKFLDNQLRESWETRVRTHRRTRRLMAQIISAENEQSRLVRSLLSTLNSPPKA